MADSFAPGELAEQSHPRISSGTPSAPESVVPCTDSPAFHGLRRLWEVCTYLLSLQLFFLTLALFIYGIFWAIQPGSANLVITVIYTLCLANLTVIMKKSFNSLYTGDAGRSVRYWTAYVGLLALCTPLMVALATAAVFLLVRSPGYSFTAWLFHGWKFPSLATLAFGVGAQIFHVVTRRLETRNLQLQQQVESETAQLEFQEQELKRAREMQQALLPKEIPQLEGFEIAGTWEPARIVGGDYFDVIRLSESKVGICIADVVGKSVSGALLMANVQAIVRAFAAEAASPAWLCDRINATLCGNIAPEKFVTLFYGVLDAGEKTLQYTSAGHPPPLLLSAAHSVRQLETGGAVLGVFRDWKFANSIVQLAPGDRLVLFTDGITEAAAPGGEQLGEEGLVRFLQPLVEEPPSKLNAALLANVRQFCDSQLQDDATLISVAVTAAAGSAEKVSRAAKQAA